MLKILYQPKGKRCPIKYIQSIQTKVKKYASFIDAKTFFFFFFFNVTIFIIFAITEIMQFLEADHKSKWNIKGTITTIGKTFSIE